MKGNEEATTSALQQLAALAGGVKHSSHEIKEFGVGKYFATKSGKDRIVAIENDYKVIKIFL